VTALPEAVADRTSAEQIMSNLIGNVIKYRDRYRACEIHVPDHRFAHEAVLAVRDTGSGIDEQDLMARLLSQSVGVYRGTRGYLENWKL
jgi:signal transduction histidine kinase